MKFSDDMVTILKNFATINPSILFRPGNVLRTIHDQGLMRAKATIDATVDGEAAVYDLAKFLSIISLYKEPDVEFAENKFVIRAGKSVAEVTYTNPEMIKVAPDEDFVMPTIDARADIPWTAIQHAVKAAGMFRLPNIQVSVENGTLSLSAVDPNDPTSDRERTEVATGVEHDGPVSIMLRIENMKMIQQDYKMTICEAGPFIHFAGPHVEYWIAGLAG